MELKKNEVIIPDILYTEYSFPQELFEKLKIGIESPENNKISNAKNLAGNIEEEFTIVTLDRNVVDFLEECARDFWINDKQVKENEKECFKAILDSIWVNKQKKYEFNPTHSHDGFISFVCWVNIPYDVEEEINTKNCKNSNTSCGSLFEFVYTDYYGKICIKHLKVDKSWEGKCIFFDSRLMHQVYPFSTSDGYRISVSGNFSVIDTRKNKKQNSLQYN